MHRIDGPGATVDNKFTEGDPVGGVQATVVTGDWLNDVQEELMSLLSAASITPVKGTQNQVLQALRTIGAGVVGSMRNGKMSVVTASSSATFSADEVVVKAALGKAAWLLPTFNKTVSLAATGAGGMDTGAAPVSGYVALYAIYNPTTGVSALLAKNATAGVQSEIYGGANMPAGYTASALLTVVPTNASGQFKAVYARGRKVFIPATQVYTGSTGLSVTPISVSSALPPNAVTANGTLSVSSTIAGVISLDLYGDSNTLGIARNTASIAASGTSASTFNDVPIITMQTIYASASNSTGGTPTYGVTISGYEI